MEGDGQLRVVDAATAIGYPRPDEAGQRLQDLEAAYKKEVALRQQEVALRQQEVALRQQLEAELARLRSAADEDKTKDPKKGRRRKP